MLTEHNLSVLVSLSEVFSRCSATTTDGLHDERNAICCDEYDGVYAMSAKDDTFCTS